jgi:uncharacterized protein YndB with AHSA1/START domain
MHGPDGTGYPNATYYHEVRERQALIYDHGAAPGSPPLFRVTALFKESGGKTALEMTMRLATPEAVDEILKLIKQAGGNSTWDRLTEYVERKSSGKEVFVINRSFDAPLERVFEMWTNPHHLAKWLPPEGMQMEVLRGEIEPGGSVLSRMYAPGIEFYFRADYREVQSNRVVYTQRFCDKDGRVSRHPYAPAFPETLLTTVALTPEGPERTRVTISMEPQGAISQEELDFFTKERGGMTNGWTGSFDKLEGLFPDPVAAVLATS